MSNLTELVAWLAAWAYFYLPTVQLATVLACGGIAAVILMLRREMPEERWAQYFGWAFMILALQYLPHVLGNWLPSWAGLQDLILIIASPANNLLFLAATRALLGHRQLRGHFPPWAWSCALVTVAAELLLAGSWIRLPDALFSAFCLGSLGWAMYLNFRSPRRRWLPMLSLVGGGSYAATLLFYGISPVFVGEGPSPFATSLDERLSILSVQRPIPIDISPLAALDSLAFSTAFLLKLLLFIGAMLLIMKCLAALSPSETRRVLGPVLYGRKEFLTHIAVVRALGESVEADLAVLCFRLPGARENRVVWWRWLRDLSLRPDLKSPTVEKMPPAHRSIVGWVFAEGSEVTTINRHKDPRLKGGRYLEYVPGMKAFTTVPIYYQGAAIGCLNLEWKHERAFTSTALQRIRQMAALLAPTVHASRQLFGLDLLGRRLRDLEFAEGGLRPQTVAKAIEIARDCLDPFAVSLFFQGGFRTLSLAVNERGDLLDLSRINVHRDALYQVRRSVHGHHERFTLRRARLRVGKQECGRLYLVIAGQGDLPNRPSLARDALHRDAVASLLVDTLLDTARMHFERLLNRLQGRLDSTVGLSTVGWLEGLRQITEEVGISGLAAQLRDDPGSEVSDGGTVGETIRDLERWAGHRIDFGGGLTLILPLNSANALGALVRVALPNSGGSLRLGVERPGFGWELRTPTPWRHFLKRLAQIADAALVRVERERLRFETTQLTLLATRVETAGMMIHEARNQALEFSTGVLGVRDALYLNEIDKAKRRVVELQAGAERFSDLARQLMQPVRGDGRRVISLKQAVDQVRTHHEGPLEARQIRLTISIADEIQVEMPLEVLVLALTNLVANAATAIGRGGEIQIEASNEGKCIHCHCTDDGPGVPARHLSSLFEFDQPTRPTGGGLGLPLARSALRRHRGDLFLAENQPGQTRFTLRLPRLLKENVYRATETAHPADSR